MIVCLHAVRKSVGNSVSVMRRLVLRSFSKALSPFTSLRRRLAWELDRVVDVGDIRDQRTPSIPCMYSVPSSLVITGRLDRHCRLAEDIDKWEACVVYFRRPHKDAGAGGSSSGPALGLGAGQSSPGSLASATDHGYASEDFACDWPAPSFLGSCLGERRRCFRASPSGEIVIAQAVLLPRISLRASYVPPRLRYQPTDSAQSVLVL